MFIPTVQLRKTSSILPPSLKMSDSNIDWIASCTVKRDLITVLCETGSTDRSLDRTGRMHRCLGPSQIIKLVNLYLIARQNRWLMRTIGKQGVKRKLG